MKKIFSLALVFVSFAMCQDQPIALTSLIRQEVAQHTNSNITPETHPVIYSIVEECVTKAGVAMPRYVSLYYAEYNQVGRYGTVYKNVHDMLAYVDAMGDLYICREILTNLTYEEIRAIIAIAIAEKATKRAEKAVLAGVGTFGLTIASLYALNSYFELTLGNMVRELLDSRYTSYHDRENTIQTLTIGLISPSLLSAVLTRNYLQKKVDVEASKIAGVLAVTHAIESLEKLQDTYRKEDIVSRLAKYLKLKRIFNIIFYPVRASTPAERIQYLQSLQVDKESQI